MRINKFRNNNPLELVHDINIIYLNENIKNKNGNG
jgi:hypothetical protein